MIVNASNLDMVRKSIKAIYSDAILTAPVHWGKIAMSVGSQGSSQTYGWLGMFPKLREWIGPRVVKGLKAHGFTTRGSKRLDP